MYLEKLDSIRKILTGLDWASLKQLTPKRARGPKLLAKKQKIEKSYDELFDAVNTLLEEPDEVPELEKNMLVDQATTGSATQDDSDSTDGVWIGVQLTATVVHLDTVVLSTSRAKTLWYVVNVPQVNATKNITFPEEGAPGDWNEIEVHPCTV